MCKRGLSPIALSPIARNAVHDAEQVRHCLSPEHLDSGVAEILQTLEQGAGGKMTAYMHYAAALVQAGYAVKGLLLEHIHLPLETRIIP